MRAEVVSGRRTVSDVLRLDGSYVTNVPEMYLGSEPQSLRHK